MAAIDNMEKQAKRIADHLERAQLAEYVQLLNSPRKLIVRNFIAGTARGIGIALGFTIFSAVIVCVLRQLGALDLPIIGRYIAELVEAVQAQYDGGPFY
jgi:hypothetical protein